jgi:Flp pilus assembly secretin CpaC
VRVDARVFELNRTRLRTFEFDLAILLGDFDQPPLLPSALADLIQGDDAARVGSFGEDDVLGALGLIGGALVQQTQVVTGHLAIDALLTLLERRSIARTLSHPAVTVLSGETARFSVGGEIPIAVSVSTSASAANDQLLESTVFAPFGISLAVRPLVGDDGSITLDVSPDVSQPDLGLTAALREATGEEQSATAFETRSLRTTTRLLDGQALVLAGLVSRSESRDVSGPQGLREVPGLGWLIGRDEEQGEDLELVVVVSPSVLRAPRPELALWEFPDVDELLPVPAPTPAGGREPFALERHLSVGSRVDKEVRDAGE